MITSSDIRLNMLHAFTLKQKGLAMKKIEVKYIKSEDRIVTKLRKVEL